MDYLIVDFEANMGHIYADGIDEIIQFSAGLYEETNVSNQIKYFNSYIKPQFGVQWQITKITGIKSNNVNHAPNFSKYTALLQSNFYESVVFVSFSDNDIYYFLENSLKYHVNNNWVKGYIDLQEIVMIDNDLESRPSLSYSLSLYGLDFIGKHHDAYYDVLNTIRLFRKIHEKFPSLNKWTYNRKEFLQKYNLFMKIGKNGRLVITKKGKKDLQGIFKYYKNRDTNYIMNTGAIKRIMERNFIDLNNKEFTTTVRRYIDDLFHWDRFKQLK